MNYVDMRHGEGLSFENRLADDRLLASIRERPVPSPGTTKRRVIRQTASRPRHASPMIARAAIADEATSASPVVVIVTAAERAALAQSLRGLRLSPAERKHFLSAARKAGL